MKINLTEKAINELKTTMETKEQEKTLRIYVAGHGWGGPSFGLTLDESKEGDTVVSTEGYEIAVEEGLDEMFDSFTVDYSDSWLRKGFVVMPDRGVSSSC